DEVAVEDGHGGDEWRVSAEDAPRERAPGRAVPARDVVDLHAAGFGEIAADHDLAGVEGGSEDGAVRSRPAEVLGPWRRRRDVRWGAGGNESREEKRCECEGEGRTDSGAGTFADQAIDGRILRSGRAPGVTLSLQGMAERAK